MCHVDVAVCTKCQSVGTMNIVMCMPNAHFLCLDSVSSAEDVLGTVVGPADYDPDEPAALVMNIYRAMKVKKFEGVCVGECKSNYVRCMYPPRELGHHAHADDPAQSGHNHQDEHHDEAA